jgi:hypothetical protein
VGGVQHRQGRREERNAAQSSTSQGGSSQAYLDCMVSKGYSVSP